MTNLQKVLSEKNINLAEWRKFVEEKSKEPKPLISMAKALIVATCTEKKIAVWYFVQKQIDENNADTSLLDTAKILSNYALFLAWEELERDNIELLRELQQYNS